MDACAQVDTMSASFLFTFYCDTSPMTSGSADSVLHWRNLNYFSTYLVVEFTDGSKWEDMSKVHLD